MERADQVLAVARIDRRSCRRPRNRPAPAAWSAPARRRGRGAGSRPQSPPDRRPRRRRARPRRRCARCAHRAAASQTCCSMSQLFDASPGGTMIAVVRMPAARERRLGGAEVARRDGLVGDDRGRRAGLQRRDARPELGEQPAADHDVIGALAERHLDGHRFAGAQRRGHGGASRCGRRARGRAARPARR